jgi:hypothetical protein
MWELDRDVILQVLPELDGHSSSHPSLFAKAGFPDAFVKALTIVHKDDLQRGISWMDLLASRAEIRAKRAARSLEAAGYVTRAGAVSGCSMVARRRAANP